jgi:DNA-binding CsgD family transcriptional regulator
MSFDNSYTSPSPRRYNTAVEKLGRLKTEFMSEALRRAADDARAAMMHQLSEPLTVLLFHLHEIKRVGQLNGIGSCPTSLCEIVDMALREADQVCAIVERNGKAVEAPVEAEAAVTRVERAESPARLSNSHPLTPREHEVLALIIGGYSNKEGGRRLGISTRTFEAHRAHLMGKLGTRNAADLVRVTLRAMGPVQSDTEGLTPATTAAG